MTGIVKETYEKRIVYGNSHIAEGYKENKKAIACFDRLYKSVETLKQNYLQIGKELCAFEMNHYYEAFGYLSLADFCQNNLRMDKGAVSRCMNVWKMVSESVDGTSVIWDEYVGYSYSQLTELVTLEEPERKEITPEMTVKEIREFKRKLKGENKGIVHNVAGLVMEDGGETERCDVATGNTEIMNQPEEPEYVVEESKHVDNSLYAYLQTLDAPMFARAIRSMNAYCLKETERTSYIKILGLLNKDVSIYFEKVEAGEKVREEAKKEKVKESA